MYRKKYKAQDADEYVDFVEVHEYKQYFKQHCSKSVFLFHIYMYL